MEIPEKTFDQMRDELWQQCRIPADIWDRAQTELLSIARKTTLDDIRAEWHKITDEQHIRNALTKKAEEAIKKARTDPESPEPVILPPAFEEKIKRTLTLWHVPDPDEPPNPVREALYQFFNRQVDTFILRRALNMTRSLSDTERKGLIRKTELLNGQSTKFFGREMFALAEQMPELFLNEIEINGLLNGAIVNIVASFKNHSQIHVVEPRLDLPGIDRSTKETMRRADNMDPNPINR